MQAHDAAVLLIAIGKARDEGFKLQERDKSIIYNIVQFMKARRPLSDKQSNSTLER